MPKIKYQNFNFGAAALQTIAHANEIMEDYAARGISMTLRSLYYRFVAAAIIANKQSEYKRLGDIVNNGRLAGLIDWNHLQDRTRNLQTLSHWENPGHVVQSAALGYHRNLWEGQVNHVEVWIEKDALLGVIEAVCEEWDVPYFSCRGYTSQSEMWSAAQRMLRHERCRQRTHIIHLGDHDPSGKDMSRDIQDRLNMFGAGTKVHRIALNMDQVEQYSPPPNPAKLTDTRATKYIDEFGDESWELDALDPAVMIDLIRDSILALLDQGRFDHVKAQQENERRVLTSAAENWDEVSEHVKETYGE